MGTPRTTFNITRPASRVSKFVAPSVRFWMLQPLRDGFATRFPAFL